MKKNPGNYIAQPLVELSTHPDPHRGQVRAAARRPPPVHPLRRPHPGAARRAHPGGPARRLLRGQLLPGRRQQGHLGAGPARAMILSRVADGLYWMGRYLERAENTTRLLLVTEELSTEVLGLDEELARGEWTDLRAIFPGFPEGEPPFRHLAGLASASLLGPLHRSGEPLLGLPLAQEGARQRPLGARGPDPRGVHQPQRDLPGAGGPDPAPARRPRRPSAARCSRTHRGHHEHGGRHRAHPDPRRGLALPQAGRVARAGLPHRGDPPHQAARRWSPTEPKVDLPLFYSQWRSLLRGLSCLENYRKVFGARLEPIDVLQFLLFDAQTPALGALRGQRGEGAPRPHLERERR